jgi:hypothetical protein
MTIGRLVGTIAAVLLLAGAGVLVFFRTGYSAEGLYRLRTAVGVEASQPERHVVPAGFHGWAVLRFSVTGAPPLPVDGGALVAEYPASGRLETSNSAGPEAGFLHRDYFCRTADGLAPLSRMSDVWGEFNHIVLADGPNAAITSAGFFVGTLAEYRAAERPQADVEPPEPPPRPDTEPP